MSARLQFAVVVTIAAVAWFIFPACVLTIASHL